MSDFIESVDDMIARDFAFAAVNELDGEACAIKDRPLARRVLYHLIRTSIAHARRQVEGRKTGAMGFDEAMRLVRSRKAIVTRPAWDIFRAIRRDLDDHSLLWSFEFDNFEGGESGDGMRYKPTDEDRTATDWMIYQTPEENWLELNLHDIESKTPSF